MPGPHKKDTRNSLSHVNTPDASTATQIQDPRVFLVVDRSAMKSVFAGNKEDLVENVESLTLGLVSKSASRIVKGWMAK